jgi:hypothetical protein
MSETKSFWATLPGILTGIASIITAIGVLWQIEVIRPGANGPPNVIHKAEQLSREWATAVRHRNIDKLVALAEPPFFFLDEILTSDEQIRQKYQIQEFEGVDILGVGPQGVPISEHLRRNKNLRDVHLTNDDIAVGVGSSEDPSEECGLVLYFRKDGSSLQMAGIE